MSAKTGQSVAALFVTVNPAIGSAVDADSLPTGTLYLNGVANGAAVTVTNLATGLYKASVTMPTLAAGDRVSLSVDATVGGVTGKGVIWGDVGETATVSDVQTRLGAPAGASVVADIATRAATGAAMTLTSGERTSIGAAVWATATRTLSGFGTLAADVWASAARALTDKTGFALTSAYDHAKDDVLTPLATVDGHVSDTFDDVGDVQAAVDIITAAVAALPADADIAALDALLDAIKLKTDAIGAVSVTVTSPVAESGAITLYQSADYNAEDGRSIDILIAVSSVGADLTGATVKIHANDATFTANAVDVVDADYRLRFEYTYAETAALTAGSQDYQLLATLSPSGRHIPLGEGELSVERLIAEA